MKRTAAPAAEAVNNADVAAEFGARRLKDRHTGEERAILFVDLSDPALREELKAAGLRVCQNGTSGKWFIPQPDKKMSAAQIIAAHRAGLQVSEGA